MQLVSNRLLHNKNEKDFLIWSPNNCNIESFILSEALKNAESVPIELNRNLRKLMPSQTRIRNELPSSLFRMTLEKIKREQQSR